MKINSDYQKSLKYVFLSQQNCKNYFEYEFTMYYFCIYEGYISYLVLYISFFLLTKCQFYTFDTKLLFEHKYQLK